MTWDGQERRSRLAISGPWGLRIVVVGASAILCLLIGFILGGGAGIWAGWVTR